MGGHDAYRRSFAHTCGRTLAGLLLLAGCSSGGTPAADGTKSPAGASASGTPAPTGTGPAPSGSPARSLVPELDEAKQPTTAAQARALIGQIMVDQEVFGPDVVRGTPYESDPAVWPVLGPDCAWRTSGLPEDVLATSTRYFRIPPKDGRGTVRVSTTVTVHRNRAESGWETARSMEEVMRCPDQRLNAGEQLKGLIGTALFQGEQGNMWTEEAFAEYGEILTAEGGPYDYTWSQGQFGPVTMAVTVKGGAGATQQSLNALLVQGTSRMMIRAGQAIGKEAR
ncbi:hypothetical protein [Streptomyces sp. NPDC090022]|uniref:hypothetical protein n=1 Tax=Streptomyces sp. NPDC090022 TaxID=3365920 RepID=UPI0038037866